MTSTWDCSVISLEVAQCLYHTYDTYDTYNTYNTSLCWERGEHAKKVSNILKRYQ